ncbi:MAG TPA: hypothetical protein VJ570_12775 [Holophagaceae bacterium]|nr:hypothetical protein [Holophagaceae bacterium]
MALLVGLDMLLFAGWKARLGVLPELLWFCNAASLALVPALWFEASSAVGMVLLLRVALGEPSHLYAFAVTGDVEWVSVAANLPPLLAAWWYLRGRAFPRESALWALSFVGGTFLLARLFTPPELNVNLVFRRHGLLARPFPGLWSYRVAATLLIATCLGAGQALLSRWLHAPSARAEWKEAHP